MGGASGYMPETTVEIAFNAGPATDPASRTWTDVSDYVELDAGIQITGGRADERTTCEANTVGLVVDNSDGRFTPELASSPYYPNVKLRRPIRVRSTYPPTSARNLLSAANADFESGVGSWTAGGTVPPTLAQSATRAWSGSNSLRITWGTGGTLPLAQVALTGLTVSSVYTFAVYVWVPTGAPNVQTAIGGIGAGTATSVKDSWVRLTQTFTATSTSHNLQIWPASSPTAGQQVWVDAAMAVAGADVGDFNTVTPVTSTRFQGFVDEWPTDWPDSVDSYATARISASSRMAILGSGSALKPLLEETLLAGGPTWYWPLSEAEGSTTALSLGSSTTKLRTVGGTVAFGNENGPLTDESTAALFSFAGAGTLRATAPLPLGSAFTVEGLFTNVAGDGNAVVVQLTSPTSAASLTVTFSVTAAAPVLVEAVLYPSSGGAPGVAQNIAPTVTDNAPHHWAVTVNGAVVTAYWDGVLVADDTASAAFPSTESFTFTVGALSGTSGDSHALAQLAIFPSSLSIGTIGEHRDAALNGYPTDTAADRLARYADMAGIPTSETDFSAATTTIDHIDTSGANVLDPMRKVEATDGGVLFDSRAGALTYQSLASRYTATAAVSLSFNSHEIGDRLTPKYDLQGVVNDATATYAAGGVRVYNQTSIDDYGPNATTVDLASSDDELAYAAAAWMVNTYKDPRTRIPNLEPADLTQLAPAKVASILAMDVGSVVATTDWPTQAAASSADLVVEGYAETIGLESHVISWNVSPAAIWTGTFKVEDATRGKLDDVYRLAR